LATSENNTKTGKWFRASSRRFDNNIFRAFERKVLPTKQTMSYYRVHVYWQNGPHKNTNVAVTTRKTHVKHVATNKYWTCLQKLLVFKRHVNVTV